ncbi:MAG: hypothetical protein MI862_12695 [Desulfobacterales bacterium]|nr:hypothetical protein [Desulfobacterales bacterium]
MSKIDLKLDFDAILGRINLDKKGLKPSVWADMLGVSRNIVTNVHGKIKQKPSLEYIVAVSKATGKSVDYYLWGMKEDNGPVADFGQDFQFINQFTDRNYAKSVIRDLLKLDQLDSNGLEETHDFIRFKMDKAESKKEKGALKAPRKNVSGD